MVASPIPACCPPSCQGGRGGPAQAAVRIEQVAMAIHSLALRCRPPRLPERGMDPSQDGPSRPPFKAPDRIAVVACISYRRGNLVTHKGAPHRWRTRPGKSVLHRPFDDIEVHVQPPDAFPRLGRPRIGGWDGKGLRVSKPSSAKRVTRNWRNVTVRSNSPRSRGANCRQKWAYTVWRRHGKSIRSNENGPHWGAGCHMAILATPSVLLFRMAPDCVPSLDWEWARAGRPGASLEFRTLSDLNGCVFHPMTAVIERGDREATAEVL